jgi:hypothetical protein
MDTGFVTIYNIVKNTQSPGGKGIPGKYLYIILRYSRMSYVRLAVASFTSLLALFISLPILVIGLPFWFVVILQRALYIVLRRARPLPSKWDALIQYDPLIGWKPKPNMKTYARDMGGNYYKLTTDEYGWRKSLNGSEGHDVIVFGDSFAFGFGANDREFFANIVSTPRIKVIGANGYNMVQQLMLMKEYKSLLRGKMVIWFVYHGNDLYENLTPNMRQYRMPFIRELNGSSEWEIVTSHVNPSYWSINTNLDYYGKLAEICSNTPLSKRAFAACNFLIKKAKEICDLENARLIIFSLPDIAQIDTRQIAELAEKSPDKTTFDPDLPDRELKNICESHRISFYTIKDYLTPDHYLHNDVHWNRMGNRKVAELIKEEYLNPLNIYSG